MSHRVFRIAILFWTLTALAVFFSAPVLAGGGPENVFVVVNPRSWASQTIANHYCSLRRIPPGNVVYVDWDQSVTATDVETFRKKILGPVVEAINRRKIAHQIDYIVYSSDYPYAINVAGDLSGKPKNAVGSITGLTYLWGFVMAKRPDYAAMNCNLYMRTPLAPRGSVLATRPTHGFRSRYRWSREGQIVPNDGVRYALSTMLGYTSGRGNSVGEVLNYLQRSVLADGTHPKGTIYFVKNSNVRSSTRHEAFPEAVRLLEKLGVAAEVVDGTVPRNRKDVQGAVIGTASFSWGSSGSTIRPGAICEHLTSYGGILRAGAGQTPLTELLRHGAAGASGTVVEPLAIQHKFPHPMMHVHYARGCSLAEAFYQSIFGPYQLLIVGDPLCRPWAKIPIVSVEGLTPGQTVKGKIAVKPSARTAPSAKIDRFELFLDGTLKGAWRPTERFNLNTEGLREGYHDLRIVAVEDSPIETQGRMLIPITVNNRGRTIRAQTRPADAVA